VDSEKKSSDIDQSGEVKHSIEVTPEMIEAGRDALAQFDPEYLLDWEIVRSVYLAMEAEKADLRP
jgi:hypothetical protein